MKCKTHAGNFQASANLLKIYSAAVSEFPPSLSVFPDQIGSLSAREFSAHFR